MSTESTKEKITVKPKGKVIKKVLDKLVVKKTVEKNTTNSRVSKTLRIVPQAKTVQKGGVCEKVKRSGVRPIKKVHTAEGLKRTMMKKR